MRADAGGCGSARASDGPWLGFVRPIPPSGLTGTLTTGRGCAWMILCVAFAERWAPGSVFRHWQANSVAGSISAIKTLFMRQHGSQAEEYKGQRGQVKCDDY